MLARVVILVVGETRIVWKALVTEGGWYTRCACGRILHQFHADGKPRPSHVQCPGCQKWTVAP
jgi:hypothetical protein